MKLFIKFFNGLVVIVESELISGYVKERPRNYGSIPRRDKSFLSFLKPPKELWFDPT
jgi:hypothetical protein